MEMKAMDDGVTDEGAPSPVGKRPTMVNFIMRPNNMVNFMKMMATT
jgi:hypothetical protein